MNTTRTITPTQLPDALNRLPYTILESVNTALNLHRVETLAKTLCPTKTGTLRDTITVQRPSNTTAILTAGNPTVTYAKAVHDGTSRQPARPFLTQALHAEALNIAQEINTGVVTRL